MNGVVKGVIIFVSGAAVGGVGAWLGTRGYYREKANREIEETQQMYYDKLNELSEAMAKIEDTSLDNPELSPEEDEDDSDDGDEHHASSGLKKEKSSIDEVAEDKRKKEPEIDYSVYFKRAEQKIKDLDMIKRSREVMASENLEKEPVEEVDPSELESPEDDEELDDEEDMVEQDDYEMYLVNEEHRRAVAENRLPYLIDAEDFGHIPGYDTMDLYYYTEDNVLADENREEVDIPDLFVGSLLEDGWYEKWSESICVRSDVTMTDVEVHKIDGKFFNE